MKQEVVSIGYKSYDVVRLVILLESEDVLAISRLNAMLKFTIILFLSGLLQAREGLVIESVDVERQKPFIDSLIEYIEVNILFCWLSATVCSLWAMYTRRSSILWFILGLVAPISLIVMLIISSRDLNKGRMKFWD